MPELPEVETVRQTLIEIGIVNQTIQKVEVYNNKLIKGITEKEFISTLAGQTIEKIERKGKWLFFFCGKWVLISHLRMTGKYFLDETLMNLGQKKSVYLTFFLNNGKKLIYSDARGFGVFHLQPLTDYQELKPYKDIGQELFNEEIDLAKLFARFQKLKVPIKITLLEQNLISGIGNIYASEILFFTKINPLKLTSSLDYEKVKEIVKETQRILKEAVELGGTSIVDFVSPLNKIGNYQLRLKAYGRDKQPCYDCQTTITKLMINGRSSFFARIAKKNNPTA